MSSPHRADPGWAEWFRSRSVAIRTAKSVADSPSRGSKWAVPQTRRLAAQELEAAPGGVAIEQPRRKPHHRPLGRSVGITSATEHRAGMDVGTDGPLRTSTIRDAQSRRSTSPNPRPSLQLQLSLPANLDLLAADTHTGPPRNPSACRVLVGDGRMRSTNCRPARARLFVEELLRWQILQLEIGPPLRVLFAAVPVDQVGKQPARMLG